MRPGCRAAPVLFRRTDIFEAPSPPVFLVLISDEELPHERVDQVVAVLGEDRLGVELDAAVVRAGERVDVAGGRVGLDA